MSLADEVLAEHVAFECETLFCSNRPHGICRICAKFWPCDSVRLATQLKAAGRVVDWFRKNRGGTWDDLRQEADCGEGPLAEYDKEGQG